MAYITIDTVKTRTERVVAVLPARLAVNEDHTVRVASPVVGRIRTLDARPGDRVEVGQALAHVVSSDLAQAESDRAKAEAALTQAGSALARAQDLFANQVVAQREVEAARNDEAQARAEAVRARQRVAQLGGPGPPESASADFVLRAPIAGEVIDRSTNPGAEVRPDAGTTLFTISSLDTLWVIASAYQQDLANVRRGEHLVFTTETAPNRRFVATVSYVSGALDSVTRTATVRATLPNPGRRLRPETFGQVQLIAADTSRAVVVPTQALITEGAGRVVFVQTGPATFARRSVVVGDDDGEFAVIATGLSVGELVVTRGSILLAGASTPGR
jgi:membrane fusion protein, heavy metal efflux system